MSHGHRDNTYSKVDDLALGHQSVSSNPEVTAHLDTTHNPTAHHGSNISQDPDSKTKVPFKAKVEGYAKKFAGKTFGKEHEVAAGEARLRGEDQPKTA